MRQNSSGGGANPPIRMRWQIGKTRAVVRFVRDATKAMDSKNDFTEEEKRLLQSVVDRMKDGTESLTEWQTVEGWLFALHNHHP